MIDFATAAYRRAMHLERAADWILRLAGPAEATVFLADAARYALFYDPQGAYAFALGVILAPLTGKVAGRRRVRVLYVNHDRYGDQEAWAALWPIPSIVKHPARGPLLDRWHPGDVLRWHLDRSGGYWDRDAA